MDHGRLKRLLEFFVIGIIFGVTEDVLAVLIATDAELTFELVGVVVLIAIPFAILSELVVDHPRFLHFDRLAMRLRASVFGQHVVHQRDTPGSLQEETAPLSHHHYRCDICEVEFETGELLYEHLDRQHSGLQLDWRITVEQLQNESGR